MAKCINKKLEANVERYSRTPVAGIVVLGSTGEAILLSDQERRDVLKAALAAAAPNKVMIAGTGIESAHETLRLTEYAAELGYDAAMVRTPHYYKKQMVPANLLAFLSHRRRPVRRCRSSSTTSRSHWLRYARRSGDRTRRPSEHRRHQGIERQPRQSEKDGRRHAQN